MAKEAHSFKAKVFNPDRITRNVLVIAPSGRGKSHAIKNLDPKSTVIINVEGKPLPFKQAGKFKKHIVLDQDDPLELFKLLKYFAKDESVSTIVIDSFSEWSDYVLLHCKKHETNYAIYGRYAEYAERLFRLIKRLSASDRTLNIILTAHDDVITNQEGVTVKSTKVKGRELQGQVERHFTLVVYGIAEFEDGNNEYKFQVQSDGVVPAKSPEGMFGDHLIDNDYKLIIDAMNDYWGN